MNFFNLLFLGKYGNYHKTNWYEALFAKVVGAGRKLIAKFLKIKGNTIVWNQLMRDITNASNYSGNGGTISYSDGGILFSLTSGSGGRNFGQKTNVSATSVTGHKYFYSCDLTLSKVSGNVTIAPRIGQTISFTGFVDGAKKHTEGIFSSTGDTALRFFIYPHGTGSYTVEEEETALLQNPMIIDLTAMFGSAKADEIYAMEQSQAGSGVAYFRSLYPLPYYSYEQGKLLPFGTPQQVTWNQLVDAPATSGDYDMQGVSVTYGTNTITLNSGTSINGFKTSYNRYDLTSGHKYAIWGSPKNSNVNNFYLYIADASTGNVSRKAIFAEPEIYDCQVTENARLYVHVEKGITANHNVFQPQIVDLTVMYGSGKEPSIEYFKQNYSGYYPYDSGSTVSANVSGIKTVGFNQWDEEWEEGFITPTTGENTSWSGRIRSKNYIPLLQGEKYYFNIKNNTSINNIGLVICYYDANKTYISGSWVGNAGNPYESPANASYMRFAMGDGYGSATYNHDICINISSSENGKYEPYTSSTTSLPISTYFPTGMKRAGNVFDELTNSKAITRIGSFTINGDAVNQVGTASTGVNYAAINRPSDTINNSVNLKTVSYLPIATVPSDSGYIRVLLSGVYLYDNAFTDLATAQSILNANPVTVYYESATPTEVTIDPPLELNYQVWNGGTEQLLPVNTDVPVTSPILADIKYPDGERDDQYFTYRQYLPNSRMMSMALNTIMGRNVEFNQQALDILMKGE